LQYLEFVFCGRHKLLPCILASIYTELTNTDGDAERV
jgi:hypothetical protein